MSSSDWYRKTTWSEADAADFEQRLSRSRSQRTQYLKIQACVLADTDDPDLADPAIELANRYLEEDPAGLFAAQAHLAIARARTSKQDTAGAIEAYRDAVTADWLGRGVHCAAYLEFAWFVTTRRLTDLFHEAMGAFDAMRDTDLTFPLSRYKYFGALAFIAEEWGDVAQARRMAINALEAAQSPSPFPRHKGVGLVGRIADDVQQRIQSLAA